MAQEPVIYERRGKLAVLTLNRAEALNALTYEMIAAVERLARQAEADPEVGAICITGAGRGFCAGIDMQMLTEHSSGSGGPKPRGDKRPALFSFLVDITKPVIAAINGPAAGGGFVLAMMCDLRFMADEASLVTVFARRGLIAEHGTSWLLPRMIGLSRALDLLWSSRRIDAQEAYRLGFADRTGPAADLIDQVQAYVDAMFATVSPTAVATIKRQVYAHLESTFDVAAQEAEALMGDALKHPDAKEGALSFVERRAPQFVPWTGDKA